VYSITTNNVTPNKASGDKI